MKIKKERGGGKRHRMRLVAVFMSLALSAAYITSGTASFAGLGTLEEVDKAGQNIASQEEPSPAYNKQASSQSSEDKRTDPSSEAGQPEDDTAKGPVPGGGAAIVDPSDGRVAPETPEGETTTEEGAKDGTDSSADGPAAETNPSVAEGPGDVDSPSSEGPATDAALTDDSAAGTQEEASLTPDTEPLPSGAAVVDPDGLEPITSEPAVEEQADLISITYSGNGGDFMGISAYTDDKIDPESANIVDNENSKISFSNSGYTFKCWNTAPDRSGRDYGPGEQSVNAGDIVNNNLTLYAVWYVTVTWHENIGDTGNSEDHATNMPETVEVLSTSPTIILPSEEPLRNGYSFAGWTTTEDGTGPIYRSGSIFDMPGGNVDFYAKWGREAVLEVFYDPGTTETVTGMPVDDALYELQAPVIVKPDVPKRAGYTFGGWRLGEEDRVYVPGEELFMPDGGITFFAVWIRDEYSVVYAPGEHGKWLASAETTSGLYPGDKTPAFGKSGADTSKDCEIGWVFKGWSPTVPAVIPDMAGPSTLTYVAQWDAKVSVPTPVTTYTVVYDPGRFGKWAAADQTYEGLGYGAPTPGFTGSTSPQRYKTYIVIFTGWSPDISDTVTGHVTYVAQWRVLPSPEPPGPPEPQPPVVNPPSGGGGGGNSVIDETAGDFTLASVTSGASMQEPDNPVTMTEPNVPLISPSKEIFDPNSPRLQWALFNLLLTALTVILMVLLLITWLTGGRSRKERTMTAEDGSQVSYTDRVNKKPAFRILSILVAAIAVILFLLTEDMDLPLVMMDKYTIFHVLIVAAQVALCLLSSKKRSSYKVEV